MLEVSPEVVVSVVVVSLNVGILDGAVNPLDLPVGPMMVHLGQPVLNVVLVAHASEDVVERPDVLLGLGELDTVVGEHGVNAIRHGLDQLAEELRSLHLARAFDQTDEGELAGTVDADEEAQLSLLCADLGTGVLINERWYKLVQARQIAGVSAAKLRSDYRDHEWAAPRTADGRFRFMAGTSFPLHKGGLR